MKGHLRVFKSQKLRLIFRVGVVKKTDRTWGLCFWCLGTSLHSNDNSPVKCELVRNLPSWGLGGGAGAGGELKFLLLNFLELLKNIVFQTRLRRTYLLFIGLGFLTGRIIYILDTGILYLMVSIHRITGFKIYFYWEMLSRVPGGKRPE